LPLKTSILKRLFKIENFKYYLIAYLPCSICYGQEYFAMSSGSIFYHINLEACSCNYCGCEIENIYQPFLLGDGLTTSPEGELFGTNTNIVQIDPLTGLYTLFFDMSSFPGTKDGLLCTGGGIFYTTKDNNYDGSFIYKINTNTGEISNIGYSPYECHLDLMAFNGEYYYYAHDPGNPNETGIVKLDLNDPANSVLLFTIPLTTIIWSTTATNICNTILASEGYNNELILINLIDGVITPICETPNNFWHLTSNYEFEEPTICEISLDLDCNDSSGATDADYNGDEFTCLSDGEAIADNDIGMMYDAYISVLTADLVGFTPDGINEVLEMTGSVAGITVAGSGTQSITLINEGAATSRDFKDALGLIFYNNTSLYPTAGLRTVEVQFTTESGAMSNVATAFIQVNELPLIDVDLGSDVEICEGETATFNAGNPGASYAWSSGQSSQSITVDDEGEYIVTVSDGDNCPNQDTVELAVLPVIHVSLEGDISACDNTSATLTIVSDAAFPVDVVISVSTGAPINLHNISGTYSFTDFPTEETEYMIISVVPSQPACIEITDPFQGIDVYPSYQHTFDASICEGDSIWLGFYWETEEGTYENTFETIEGCDSVVTTNLTVLPAIMLTLQATSCNAGDTGVFIQFLNNPNGCDTIVETTVTLSPSDTTLLFSSTCNSQEAGTTSTLLTNQNGCDSLVITTTTALPPADTTYIHDFSCDSMAVEITQSILLNAAGCDSLVITSVSLSPADTQYVFGVSCDPSNIGTSQQLFETVDGCDSLVITTISEGQADTTIVHSTSCDSSSLGVFEELFPGHDQCDSLVITTVTYSESDHTDLQALSCDEEDVGIFSDTLVNRFGCDSIVTLTVSLATNHDIQLSSSSCHPADTGVFVQMLLNQSGCDSIVTETISLLPSDETFLYETTCHSSQAGMFITTHFNQFGCDSVVTLTISLAEADTTLLQSFTCFEDEVMSNETLLTSVDGCDSLVIESIALHPLSQLEVISTSDFNGYDISCFGESDGSVAANVIGQGPYTYEWSTGSEAVSIVGLPAGEYSVVVTDANGCKVEDIILLEEPQPFSIGFVVSHPDCFDAESGSIDIQQSGGIEPVRYSIDGINYQQSSLFENLHDGAYEITAFDANDCEVKEIILINAPLQVSVSLGEDMIILPGDSTVIEAIVNVPFDSLSAIQWSGIPDPDCDNCLTQVVAPVITTTYSISITSIDGCKDEDDMTLVIDTETDIFIPTIFTPNDDGINDQLWISGGRDVKRILLYQVYDRWGNVVFEAKDVIPNDQSISWDGTFENEKMNPGVFAVRVIAEMRDGRQVVKVGDVTLMR
jgi:gliding motility-associated-like protein